ncbi:MAG: Phosphatidate cytidylyltransferase [Candidatus Dichloromethanomonas elyunquensis]|nr:MAG: Phosphatidate cytidylyltransferase [Candidatus Dichloromethanomonas elyunquensis]
MTKRILSALIGAPLLLFLTWLGGMYLALTVTVLALLGLREFLEIGRKANLISRSKLIVIFCILWLGMFLLGYHTWLLPLGLIWFVLIFGVFALNYPDIPFAQASYGFLAFVYPVALFMYLYFLRELPQGQTWCFYVFTIVWATDTGAFFLGTVFGKRRLVPRVSPKKSVEGAMGGLLTAVILGFIFWAVAKQGNLAAVLVLSIVTSVVSQIGDLFESALKRSADIKDSGSVIPGHGGVLDRFDGFLFVLPVVYFALVLGLVG